MPPTNENSTGPVIAIVIVLLMVILGGFYFWGQRSNQAQEQMQATATENPDAAVQTIETQSSSDSVTSINQDLDQTNVENLDSVLNF